MKCTPPVLSVAAAILTVSALLAQPAQNANVPKTRFQVFDRDGAYQLTLDGTIVGMLGESEHDLGQFNWAHGLA